MNSFDTVVIGAGPGGYVAAIRLSQLGQKVAIIERENVGGVCLNVGCIPSKAMIHASEAMQHLLHGESFGLSIKEAKLDVKKLQSWKNEIVGKLTGGVAQLLKAHKVTLLKGEAKFTTAFSLEVGGEPIEFEKAIIATGSAPVILPGFEPDGKFVGTSTEALSYSEIPKRLCVIGGCYIGLELAMCYAGFGSQVTVVEALDQLLTGIDSDLVKIVQKELKKRNVTVKLKTKALGWALVKKSAQIKLQSDTGEETIESEKILVAVGRRPNSQNIGLEAAGVQTNERGFVIIDHQCRTNVQNIFAIGDVAGGMLLAHKASKEGLVAAAVIAGHSEAYDVKAMPAVVFTTPEIATVGLTETEARAKNQKVKVARFPFAASGKSLASGETEGFVKIITDPETDLILGVGIVGAQASNLIGEACLAIEMGTSAEDMALTVHPHPTLTETLMEAAEAVDGKAIHIFQR